MKNIEIFDIFFSFHTSEIKILELNADQNARGETSGRLQRRSKMTSQKSTFFDQVAMVEPLTSTELFPPSMDRAEVLYAPRYDIELSWKNITSEYDLVLS